MTPVSPFGRAPGGATPPLLMVGNDVVDLAAPRASAMGSDARFLSRVFTDAERSAMEESTDRLTEVWRTWAAKEAVFKVVSKLRDAPPLFAHRSFEVRWAAGTARDTGEVGAGVRVKAGEVRWEGRAYPVRSEVDEQGDWVVAIATAAGSPPPEQDRPPHRLDRIDRPGAPWQGTLEALLPRFTDRERMAVRSLPSAAVRLAARADIAAHLAGGADITACRTDGAVEIVRVGGPGSQRPPLVLVDGAPSNIDVSLSHDGPWIAWALSFPPNSAQE